MLPPFAQLAFRQTALDRRRHDYSRYLSDSDMQALRSALVLAVYLEGRARGSRVSNRPDAALSSLDDATGDK